MYLPLIITTTRHVTQLFRLFHIQVIKDKEAYLLTELLEDLGELSQDQDQDEPPVMKNYGYAIDFYVVGKRLIVHPSGQSTLVYTVATLQGHGLREDDLPRAFARLIRRKISSRETVVKWPLEAQ
jgi:hypothetical protein